MTDTKTYKQTSRIINISQTYSQLKSLKCKSLLVLLFSALFLQSVVGQEIFVGGTLEQDEVWTKDFTYIVQQDLRILQNVTLTIEPGVTVKVNQGRGIFVLKGGLIANGKLGEEIDSIHFVPNHSSRWQSWKWKGIIFIGVSAHQENILSYVDIRDAEVAVDFYISDDVEVKNCNIQNNQMLGVRISNSNAIEIQSCFIHKNYDGIEMVANSADTTFNIHIHDCILKNDNHNIYMFKEAGSMLAWNQIEDNLIEGAYNGIWMDNGGGISKGINHIERNILINNGHGAGYGLLISQDSVFVKNNIFWKNYIGIRFELSAEATHILNNSFYQNYKGVILTEGSVNNNIKNNTFTDNLQTFAEIGEAEALLFDHNNLLSESGQQNIVINNTPDDVQMGMNCWNTQDLNEIEGLIWDHADVPLLGELIVAPILVAADTTNPISPPIWVKKQLVNNQVLLTWPSNPEGDFSAYKLFSGEFENYTFTNEQNIGTDTSFILTGATIYDSLAITAIDGSNIETDQQVMGFESPFAFAKLYPYAGPDTTICKSVTEYNIDQATIPFTFESINWVTDGDGTFSVEDNQHPIYYPGPMDVQNEVVHITLHVQFNGKSLSDSFTLSIIGDPVVFAGNDTIVFLDANIELISAFAHNYDQLSWESTGDGTFEVSSIVNPVYYPGPQDIMNEIVTLILIANSECGSAADTLSVLLKPYYMVEGHLWYADQKVDPGVIIAIQDNENEARAVRSTVTNPDGYFIFDKLFAGNYFMYAVPDTNHLTAALPAYYANKIDWQDAYILDVNADVYDVDIHLPAADFILPPGEASISGHFAEPPTDKYFSGEVFCQSWFDPEVQWGYCDGGVSNITVFLLNSDATKILDFTLTDINGNFYFKQLPFGNYILDAEKAGFETTMSQVIGLSPGHMHETDIVLEVNDQKIGIYRNSGSPPVVDAFQVYPNPATTELNILIPSIELSTASSVALFDIMGQQLLRESVTISNPEGIEIIHLDVSAFPTGVYVGVIANRKFSFVKK